MALLGLPAARLEVVYNGLDFHPDDPAPEEEAPPVDVPGEFFLSVGSLEPGKNLALLRSAYELAAARGWHLPPLLIVGSRREGVAHEGPPPPGWTYLGRQPDTVLVYLYRRAVALLFPSTYEGFGLPIGEAMALGLPVICSRVSSIPEVGGQAPLYADLEPAAYLDAMRAISTDGSLRAELAERGRQQARRFSWKRCADETGAVYRQVLDGRPP
jgi:alpha-1,3-rhamnosyl/mannosyltransferase